MIFCAILSNILENAMNAVKDLSLENRRIELHIFEKMNHLMLLEKNPALTNVQIKIKLKESARDMGLPKNQQGWGKFDLERFMEL